MKERFNTRNLSVSVRRFGSLYLNYLPVVRCIENCWWLNFFKSCVDCKRDWLLRFVVFPSSRFQRERLRFITFLHEGLSTTVLFNALRWLVPFSNECRVFGPSSHHPDRSKTEFFPIFYSVFSLTITHLSLFQLITSRWAVLQLIQLHFQLGCLLLQ